MAVSTTWKELTKKQKVTRIIVGVIVLFVLIGIFGGGGKNTQSSQEASVAPKTATAPAPAAPKSEQPAIPTEYKSALNKASTYSEMMHMSKAGIYDQLTSSYGEKFSAEAAQYAVDNVKADWNANALAKAKTYQESMSMSPAAIHDQLMSSSGEKFTADQADYAIAHLNS